MSDKKKMETGKVGSFPRTYQELCHDLSVVFNFPRPVNRHISAPQLGENNVPNTGPRNVVADAQGQNEDAIDGFDEPLVAVEVVQEPEEENESDDQEQFVVRVAGGQIGDHARHHAFDGAAEFAERVARAVMPVIRRIRRTSSAPANACHQEKRR
ncbi:unnamed protein product, partial [Mesorhabditis spiculigera]